MTVEHVLGKLHQVENDGADKWKACCPAHDDRNPSMSVKVVAGGKILLKCHAGCSFDSIVSALGIKASELMGDDKRSMAPAKQAKTEIKQAAKKAFKLGKVVCYYNYENEDGVVTFRAVRYEPKDFRQQCPDPADPTKWVWGVTSHNVKYVPWRLPKVLEAAQAGRVIILAEGEKDVLALESLGFVASCNPGGAGRGKWLDYYSEYFKGAKRVIIIADNDKGPGKDEDGKERKEFYQGQRHAWRVVESLTRHGIDARAMVLPSYRASGDKEAMIVKDAADWVGAGGTRAELEKLLAAALTEWPHEWTDAAYEGGAGVAAGEPAPLKEGAADSASAGSSESENSSLSPSPPVDSKVLKNVGGDGDSSAFRSAPRGCGVGEEDLDDLTTAAAVRATLFGILVDKKINSQFVKRRMMTEAVVEWLKTRGKFYFDSRLRNHSTAMYFDGRRKILFFVESDWFQSWLAKAISINRANRDFTYMLSAIQDESLSEDAIGTLPHSYWARHDGKVYISSGNGSMVRCSCGVTELCDNGTDGVLFLYNKTLDPWELVDESEEVDPFQSFRIFRDMYASEAGKMMVRLWTLSIFSCSPNKPPLVLTGPAECGKTAVARCIASLIGLMPTTANITEKGEDAFWTLMDQGGIATLDNVDTSIRWFVPAMETASTGGMNAKKKLYTDSDIVLQRTNTWPIITSLNPSFASSQALASRIIIVRLVPPDDAERTNLESALTDEIQLNRNASMSYMARVVSKLLTDTAVAPSNINKRHPDWGGWAWRAGRAIGRESDATDALQQAETDKAFLNLESSWIGETLLKVIESDWKGTATDLLKLFELKIEGWDGTDPIDRKGKKLTPTKVGKRLESVWRSLSSVMHAEKRNHSGTFMYYFKKATQPPTMLGVNTDISKGANTDDNNTVFKENTPTTPNIVGGCDTEQGSFVESEADWRDLI